MSNMLYACSILYKTRLPLVLAFNKTDMAQQQFALEIVKPFAFVFWFYLLLVNYLCGYFGDEMVPTTALIKDLVIGTDASKMTKLKGIESKNINAWETNKLDLKNPDRMVLPASLGWKERAIEENLRKTLKPFLTETPFSSPSKRINSHRPRKMDIDSDSINSNSKTPEEAVSTMQMDSNGSSNT
ncbi:GPN-loop GTPase QQT2 [Camellia lanceoleosa]|uniref:GPN-loop GTPase QQT2 n=1 Tax=Camellia lanceoleosa TaxID=1840588 RepID=A0ACC0GB29_9ERIC|nr:GPN-loop GTPase QQT2 [Camellia lanceoleosa]